MIVVICILLVLLALFLAAGYYIFSVACVRRNELAWLVEEEIKKTSYAKYYQAIVHSDQFLRENVAQELYMDSYDGLRLYGQWIPAQDPKGTILLAHGYRSTKLVDFSMVYDFYHGRGMNILVVDQRAHGKSEGKYITFGVKESRDMQAWVDYHNAHFGQYPLILSGLSMGASTMLYLADADLPKNVKGIIADCGFTSPYEIIQSVFCRVIHHLPAAPFLWVTGLFTKLIAGFDLKEKDSRQTLHSTALPVLMIHGQDDNFVPCEMTRQAYAACTGEKEMLLVAGADHGVSFLTDRARYTEMVVNFLKKNVEGFK